jgi:hypothetical protein
LIVVYFLSLLQIVHILMQMLELGSLLKRPARRYEATSMQLFGSPKNIASRPLDGFRHFHIPDDAFDPLESSRFPIRLDTS